MSTEIAIAFRDFFADSIAGDVPTTKKVLLAVPDDASKWGYKPDPKARNAFDLAWHIASVDVLFLDGVANRKFFTPEEELAYEDKHRPKSIAAMADWYEKEMKRALDRVKKMSGADLASKVQFFHYNLPAYVYLSFVKSHSIHHRGELATYLRPMGSKVPSIYGPSADEQMGG